MAVGVEGTEEHWDKAVDGPGSGPGSGRAEAKEVVPVQAGVAAEKDGECWPLAVEEAPCGLHEVARE